ncbi:MAG: hypothetical protein ABIG95_02420 [Candidatus Woesearchaeota archaeon]
MKTLYVPGRVWLSSKSFVDNFPQAALAMLVLLGDATLTKEVSEKSTIILKGESDVWGYGTIDYDLGIDQYRYNKKVEAYRDIIRYIISPQMPMTINFLSRYDKEKRIPLSFKTAGNCEDMKLEKMQLASILFEYLNELNIVTKDKLYGKKPQYLCSMVYKAQLIKEFAEKAFQYFEVRSSQENIDFSEVYNVLNPSQMQPNTISYCVVKEPPPISENVQWNNVNFWSAVFEEDVGKNILQAVAAHLPVKIKTTVTNWKDPNSYLSSATRKEADDNWIILTYTYVWQNFDIEIYEENKIIVRYNRDTATKTLQWQKDEKPAWLEILKGAAFLIAFTGAGYVLGAWGGATGIVSGAAPTATGIVSPTSGITLTAPGYVAPHLTGVTALTSQTFTIGGSTYTAAAAAVLPAATKAAVWSTVLKASPSVLASVVKAGIGLWSSQRQAKIQEELMKAGYDQYSSAIPSGMTADGQFAYASEASLFGMDTTTMLMLGGGALVLLLALRKT